MKKIISLYQRNYEGDRLVRDDVVPGAEWVLAGEGVPTRKWDGTAVMIRAGKLFKRYDAKQLPTVAAQAGQTTPKIKAAKVPPPGFEPTQDPDPVTGHWPGWVPVGDGPEDKWFRLALDASTATGGCDRLDDLPDGTYELCGPHFQGNPEGFERETFVPHGVEKLANVDPTFEGIKAHLTVYAIEGIVWHHPDGRMVKIKAKDFGIRWPR